jgi:hypothetical protein
MEIEIENQQLKAENKSLIEQMKNKDTKKTPMVINASGVNVFIPSDLRNFTR